MPPEASDIVFLCPVPISQKSMFLPLSKASKKRNPLQVTSSQHYLVAFGTSILGGVLLGGYGLFYMVQKRDRSDDIKPIVPVELTTKRIAVVGGSAAGSAAAAVLTRTLPDATVTVYEPNKESTVFTHWPLAQAGHRSYDLATGAPKILTCPTSWTVTRDAKLVRDGVRTITPASNTLTLESGETHHYDALVLACGSIPNVSGCGVEGLTEDTVDRHRVCLSPGITRDTLASIYSGDILCVKLSSSSGSPAGKPFNMKTFASHFHSAAAQYERQCDSTFPASVNMIWMFTDYFRRGRFQVKAFTDDDSPCSGLNFGDASAPNTLYGSSILDLWSSRNRMHYYPSQRLVGINAVDSLAIFEEVPKGTAEATKRRTSVPFKMMYLDVPRKAPELITRSGLSGFANSKANDSAGFAAVDPYTLQHVRHPNVFAVGDCAALPTVKSYAAAFSQAHVLAHNVSEVLGGTNRLARYDGFSSAALPMTPFRYMIPEVGYGEAGQLIRRNSLPWDDSAWGDLRGFVNAVPHQFYIYELMHWFVFMRGHWNPSSWFTLPDFDGPQ